MTSSSDRTTVVAWVMFLLAAPIAVLDGAVLLALWRWYAVPLGAPNVGLAHAIGLRALIALATHQMIPTSIDKHERMVQAVADAIVAPLAALAIGWIALHFTA